MHRLAALILALLLLTAGCATHNQPPYLIDGSPAAAPPSDAKSLLTEAQIPPPAILPRPRPATRPDVPPPTKALALYASARDAALDNRAFAAIDLLEQAIRLDPDSFELYRALGQARLAAARHPNQDELNAFESALALRPDDLRLQALVGAQYASLNQPDKALFHLRLAKRTTAYASDDVAAAAVDLLLARLLQDQGYDRAALDQYQTLIDRLAHPSYALRSDPELGGLVTAPQTLWLEIGYLDEKHGQWANALAVYQPLTQADPSSFDLQAKVVRMLANLGRTRQAVTQAADMLSRFGDSTQALALLKDVCRSRNVDVTGALGQLHAAHPADPALLLAFAQVLTDQGQTASARALLESALSHGGVAQSDRQLVSQLFDLYLRLDDVPAATRLLVIYLAAHPDELSQTQLWWDALLRPSREHSLRLPTLQALEVQPSATAAKLFLVWRLSDLWRRDILARTSLEEAVHLTPPFAPAFRQLDLTYWGRQDWDESQKQKASDNLAALAEKEGDPSLAAELRGMAALSDQRPAAAVSQFEHALTLGGSSPQLVLTYAVALQSANQNVKAEQLLWTLVAAHPQYDLAWEALFQFYLSRQSPEQAHKVLSQWLAANPASVSARIVQAHLAADDGNPLEAESILQRLFADHDDDPDVIRELADLGRRTGRLDQFTAQLDELARRQPANSAAIEALVEIYAAQGRAAEADRALDQNRQAVAKDPDLLYRVAHLYELVDQPQTTEQVLQQVVDLDPHHASACNDLGYTWAEQGKNLPRAESLIRIAVAQEPDNQSFLDSLGWVLYKQGRYAAAEIYFQQAVGPAGQPDPVVLDHFGDVLYRLGLTDDAARQWQRALTGLGTDAPDRDDLKELRLTLMRKLSQRQQNKSVGVAPVASEKRN